LGHRNIFPKTEKPLITFSLKQIQTPHINPISCPETASFQEQQVSILQNWNPKCELKALTYIKKRDSQNTYSDSGAENVLEQTRHEIVDIMK
jgi:aspartyl-tRNA synthetase